MSHLITTPSSVSISWKPKSVICLEIYDVRVLFASISEWNSHISKLGRRFFSKFGGYKVWICNRVEVRQLEWRRYQYVLFLILALFPFLLVVVFEFATELKSDSWNDGGINIRYFSLRPFHNPKHNLSVKHNLPQIWLPITCLCGWKKKNKKMFLQKGTEESFPMR